MHRLFLFLCLSAVLVSAFSQEPSSYNLEALYSAAEHNPLYLARKAEYRIASADLQLARASRYPQLSCSIAGGFQLNPSKPVEVLSGELMPPNIPPEDLIFIAGGDYPLYRFSLEASVPLFTSGFITSVIAEARDGRAASLLQRDIVLRDLCFGIKRALYRLSYLMDIRRALFRQRAVADDLLALTRENFSGGLIVQSRVLEVEAVSAEIDAKIAECEAGLNRMLWELKRLTGLYNLAISQIERPKLPDLPAVPEVPDHGQLKQSAFERNPELLLAGQLVHLGKHRKEKARSELNLRPKIGLELGLSYEGSRFPWIEENWNTPGKSQWNAYLLLGIDIALFDGGQARSRYQASSSQVQAARYEQTHAREDVSHAIALLLSQLSFRRSSMTYIKELQKSDAASLDELRSEIAVGSSGEDTLYLRKLEAEANQIRMIEEQMEYCDLLIRLEGVSGLVLLESIK